MTAQQAGSVSVFTLFDLGIAAKHGAPVQRLLTHAPLWTSNEYERPELGAGPRAHANRECPELHLSPGEQPTVLDPNLRFMAVDDARCVHLCTCTMSDAPTGGSWAHPLRRLRDLLHSVGDIAGYAARAQPEVDFPIYAEMHLVHARDLVQVMTREVADNPDMAFWAPWLTSLVAEMTTVTDRLRARIAHLTRLTDSDTSTLVTFDALMCGYVGSMSAPAQRIVSACPVVARLRDGTVVVRAATELAFELPDRSGGVVVLGDERPMTDEAWELFRLLRRHYRSAGAYRAAADSVGRLTADMVTLLRPLAKSGVPAAELIDTACTIARQ